MVAAPDGAGPVDAELGARDGEGRIDRHQRNSSSVRENICLAACIAVTFAS